MVTLHFITQFGVVQVVLRETQFSIDHAGRHSDTV